MLRALLYVTTYKSSTLVIITEFEHLQEHVPLLSNFTEAATPLKADESALYYILLSRYKAWLMG